MRLQRTKHLCNVICAYEYDCPFIEFLQMATFVVLYKANKISPNRNSIWTVEFDINKN